MASKIIIIGGVAGGATAAARARRLSEDAKIILVERDDYISYANCGLPYHIGGEIPNRENLLVQTVERLKARFALDIRIKTEAIRIDRDNKQVLLKDLLSGREYFESYDYLLLSPGAKPFIPSLSGIENPNVFSLRNMTDMDGIKAAVDKGAKRGLVIGGGFIGLEMAENLAHRGLEVHLIERSQHVMPPLDTDLARMLHQELLRNRINLTINESVESLSSNNGNITAITKSGYSIETDLVIVAVGVRPDTQFAKEAGLELGIRDTILVNENLQTSDPAIYAVGDAIQVKDSVLDTSAVIPLAGPANRQARIAVDHIFGLQSSYRGTQGTAIVRVFGLTAATTGASEKGLRSNNVQYCKVYAHRTQHAGYFPKAREVTLKLLFSPTDGKVLGAQAVGPDGVDKRIDVLATAIYSGLTVYDLEHLELAYAPQFSSAKDPVNILGNIASNLLSGQESYIYAEELTPEKSKDCFILDVREPAEFENGSIVGAVNIPLGQLRNRLGEISHEKTVVAYCQIGQRGYYATRILRKAGFKPLNLAGGLKIYQLLYPENVTISPAAKETVSSAISQTVSCCSSSSTFSDTVKDQQVLDLRGLQCPGPIASLSGFARSASVGATVKVLASDPGFETDFRAWSNRFNHQIEIVKSDADGLEAILKIGSKDQNACAPATKQSSQSSQQKTIVVFSGDLDKVLASFVIANAALDLGDKVTMFFTFWGLNALRRSENISVKKSVIDRMFGLMMPRGADKLVLSKMNFLGLGTAMMRWVMKNKNVTDLSTLIRQAKTKGVNIVACSMSMDVMGIKKEELIDGISIGGAASYLTTASDSGVNLFI